MPTLSFWRFCVTRHKRLAVYAVAWGLGWFVVVPRLPPLVGLVLLFLVFMAMAYQWGVTIGSQRMLDKWMASDRDFAERLEVAFGVVTQTKEALEQAQREQANAIH